MTECSFFWASSGPGLWGGEGRGGLESRRRILSQETGNIRPQALTQTGPGLNSRTQPVICPCDAKAPLRHPAPSPSSPWEEPPPPGAWQSWPRSANAFRRQAAARGGLPTARRRRRKSVGSGPSGSLLSSMWGNGGWGGQLCTLQGIQGMSESFRGLGMNIRGLPAWTWPLGGHRPGGTGTQAASEEVTSGRP